MNSVRMTSFPQAQKHTHEKLINFFFLLAAGNSASPSLSTPALISIRCLDLGDGGTNKVCFDTLLARSIRLHRQLVPAFTCETLPTNVGIARGAHHHHSLGCSKVFTSLILVAPG